jgi:predicted phosphoribosyltransferase
MIFNDRVQAAQLLVVQLAAFKGARPLVLGIPRGGVVLADVLA